MYIGLSHPNLFPACAGVIPKTINLAPKAMPFPRMCGGDPDIELELLRRRLFSPHVRG